ncbi:bifunctional fucokinase/GDP-fucose pyrophosphorylase isoform X3 [Physcomitrium patens]|nr:bifunctional fucokinase/fucose pyrophosphorylase-like isoform X3 [Physcomitrium patens]|eukprot:XP_024367740.1 bifunctional fucokinase/fucose pyrophosphorylase-like isoform X3 [Physcomitrella patens]
MRVLLLHTGGDSKRVPWANPIGKAFIPLPFLAGDEPDGPILTLFDHILAISAGVLQSFSNKGGLLIMTGDVLPCFDASSMTLPENGAIVITVPAPLSRASKHGVILGSQSDKNTSTLPLVIDLLQKPSSKEMGKRGAMLADGTALLDTGIFVVRGDAFSNLVAFALLDPNPVADILATGEEVSLYEEVAGAWVSARHEWLVSRPLGKKLINALGSSRLYHHCAEELEFLHFGTSSEVLDHLVEDHKGRVLRKQFSDIPGSPLCEVAASASVIGCKVHPCVSVGEGSLVFSCTLVAGTRVGSRCVAMGLTSEEPDSSFTLPDRHCLWRVPVSLKTLSGAQVVLCCGLDDDPKVSFSSGGSFCGGQWGKFIRDRGICKSDLWGPNEDENLWNAKLFPVVSLQEQGISFAMWLMGASRTTFDKNSELTLWCTSHRLSLRDLHRHINFNQLNHEVGEHIATLAGAFLKASIVCGALGRNFSQLCQSIALGGKETAAKLFKESNSLITDLKRENTAFAPSSRVCQALLDICEACGDPCSESISDACVWDAVAAETAVAVGQSVGEMEAANEEIAVPISIRAIIRSRVELPVRLDIVGGWSDTPPWSLERIGCVLNMAVQLDGRSPLCAEVLLHSDGAGVTISDEEGNSIKVDDRSSIQVPFDSDDRFRLVKAALVVTGFTSKNSLSTSGRLDITTCSNVPRGSGLGVSSVLAAAVVKGLLEVKQGDTSSENVTRLVLFLEQIMGTGGGWQDQIGGVYPGIKCTTSMPGRPISLKVEAVPVSDALRQELETRMLVAFTGQVRLAHKVLQIVVRRYLQRDARLIAAINRLAALAKLGEAAFAANDLDAIGEIMTEAWFLHQELDPNCSNSFVDSLFQKVKHLSCGHKLVGAGGGGFAIFIGKDKNATEEMKVLLQSVGPPVQVYSWALFEPESKVVAELD